MTEEEQWKYTDLGDRERYIRLRHLIENHPYLSGMLADEFHNHLYHLVAHHNEAFVSELERAWKLRKEPLSVECDVSDLDNHQSVPEEYLCD